MSRNQKSVNDPLVWPPLIDVLVTPAVDILPVSEWSDEERAWVFSPEETPGQLAFEGFDQPLTSVERFARIVTHHAIH